MWVKPINPVQVSQSGQESSRDGILNSNVDLCLLFANVTVLYCGSELMRSNGSVQVLV
jgi:hypothetical protein